MAMSDPPLVHLDHLRIGTVEYVSPDNIRISVDVDAPEATALNTGRPQQFPRVHSYILISADERYLVGQVEWITIENQPFPQRRGLRDFGLIDLPYPRRKLRLNPLGTLYHNRSTEEITFARGTELLPSVGASALLPSEDELSAIVHSGPHSRVWIGNSPIASNARILVDPSRMFGRHLAVLGNTGSGKSCSVAGIIRWSLELASAHAQQPANARFIVLDPNGEYRNAFNGGTMPAPRVLSVGGSSEEEPLQVPIWLWNTHEWSTFSSASEGVQRPTLERALREIKAVQQGIAGVDGDTVGQNIRKYLTSRIISLRSQYEDNVFLQEPTRFGFLLKAIQREVRARESETSDIDLSDIGAALTSAIDSRYKSYTDNKGEFVEYFRAFDESDILPILEAFGNLLEEVGGSLGVTGITADQPIPFKGSDLADHIEMIGRNENRSQYLDFLVTRIRTMLADETLASIVDADTEVGLEEWLRIFLGSETDDDPCVTIVDLSLVPSDVVHLVVSVIARTLFEALQRHMKSTGSSLPTVLVAEEAHVFVRRYRQSSEIQSGARVCCQVFERIAREGRKFGLGLVVSSQRPSELSPTVLSQCNSFLLHRISNDRDQEIVERLVPDNLRGLLRELPSLPSQSAVLLGWASELPVLVRIRDLPDSQRPRSDDPDYWGVWTRKPELPDSWGKIASEWQGSGEPAGEHRDAVADGVSEESLGPDQSLGC